MSVTLALATLVIALLALVVPWARGKLRQVRLAADIPGPPSLPLIGSLHKMPRHLEGPLLLVCPIDNEAFKDIAYNTVELEKGADYAFFRRWLGPGLLLGDGNSERWQKTRKAVTPAFHFNKLDEYLQTMDFHCRTLVGLLDAHAGKMSVDLYHFIKLCALDIIADTTMGVQLNAQRNPQQAYVKAVEKFNWLGCIRALRVHLRPEFIWRLSGYHTQANKALDVLHAFTTKVIKERVEVYKDDKKRVDASEQLRPNFLDIMLRWRESEQLSLTQLREEVDTLMFAGHDTTSHAVCWFLWCMATHADIQARLYAEIVEHFGGQDADIATGRVKELKYLDACLKETLRLYAPVPVIQRYIRNDMKMGKHTIPGGVSMLIPLILIHRNPKIFENPLAFDPERFAEGREYPPLAYVPFSAGQRNCVGQRFALLESKVMITHILYNFRVESDRRMEDNSILFEAVLRPQLGVPVRLIRRER